MALVTSRESEIPLLPFFFGGFVIFRKSSARLLFRAFSSEITGKREIIDARSVLGEARNLAKIKPMAIVTDSLQFYSKAITKELFTLKKPRTQYVRALQAGTFFVLMNVVL